MGVVGYVYELQLITAAKFIDRILLGVEISCVLIILISLTIGFYAILFIGSMYLFIQVVCPLYFDISSAWYRNLKGWLILYHAILQLAIFILALVFLIKGLLDHKQLSFSTCVS